MGKLENVLAGVFEMQIILPSIVCASVTSCLNFKRILVPRAKGKIPAGSYKTTDGMLKANFMNSDR